jgi:cellulose synthase/poly-beta-1,6-N-acetylglucosamine synthase-like glycosyltransferase
MSVANHRTPLPFAPERRATCVTHREAIPKITISVIIPTLNEENVIGRSLNSLIQQTLPRAAFEVILVDNGSTDRTIEIVRRFEKVLALTVVHKTGAYISALRNLGAASSRGKFLAFLDADCIAPPHWLSEAVELLQRDESAVIGARYTIPEGSSWLAKAWYGDQHTLRGPASYVPGGNLLLARSTLEKVGGFDETIETNEDSEFCYRASRVSLGVLAVPALSVMHLGTPQTVANFYRKERWHGTAVHSVFLRDVFHSRNLKSIVWAAYILCCLLTTAIGIPVALLSGHAVALLLGPLAIVLSSLALAARDAAARKRWGIVVPLTVLFVVYGLARAVCLLGIRSTRRARRTTRRVLDVGRANDALGNAK